MIHWPEKVVEDIARRKCVLYLGSGISMNSTNEQGQTPPSWSQLLNCGIEQLNDQKTRAILKRYVKEHNYLLACELLKRKMHDDNFLDLLRDKFQRAGYKAADIHESIFKLDSRYVFTTNFDNIYDNYARKTSEGTVIVKDYADDDITDYLRNKDHLILKIHGTIENTDNLIFSKIDYSRNRLEHANFYKLLEAMILTHTFIFLGAGLDDPDIQLLFENIAFQYKTSRRHIFVIPENKKRLNEELSIFEETMNLNFLKYNPKDNHKELTDSLNELVRLVETKRIEIAERLNW